MKNYRAEVYCKITGELVYEKIYNELFEIEKSILISRGLRLMAYCAHRFGKEYRGLEVINVDMN